MYITNVEELVEALKPRLQDYLVMMLGEQATKKKFPCFVHDDSDPSMHYDPKRANTAVHCFSCGASHDIFSACSALEGLPGSGPEWITQTLPHLADKLGVEVRLGEASPADKDRARQYKLAGDIATILDTPAYQKDAHEYCAKRGWSVEHLTVGSIDPIDLKNELRAKGWTHEQLQISPLFGEHAHYFGDDKVTFVIRDYRGRAIGFSSRNLIIEKPKYINTPETTIFQKRKSLFGIEVALVEAKRNGVYVVEGQGDVAALHADGILNVVASCGTAFTSEHLSLLKMLGIRQVFFCLDWDEAGEKGTMRTLREEVKLSPGVSCWVVKKPVGEYKDPGEYLEVHSGEDFRQLPKTGAFEWLVERLQDQMDSATLCAELVPVIATEPTATRRELLMKTLSDRTAISFNAIQHDVTCILDGKFEERRDRLAAAAHQFQSEVAEDPDNIMALVAQMETNISVIEAEYKRDTIGVTYQANRYNALQEQRQLDAKEGISMEFKLSRFTIFAACMSGGMTWTDGVLIYLPGRANSGKTATAIAIGVDVAITDEDAIVLMHFTDDNYSQVEPRIKSNIAEMLRGTDEHQLTIGQVANPYRNLHKKEEWGLYDRADQKFRELIENERLIVIDAEDGSTLSTLEKQLRYIRQRYPRKKLLVVCDKRIVTFLE